MNKFLNYANIPPVDWKRTFNYLWNSDKFASVQLEWRYIRSYRPPQTTYQCTINAPINTSSMHQCNNQCIINAPINTTPTHQSMHHQCTNQCITNAPINASIKVPVPIADAQILRQCTTNAPTHASSTNAVPPMKTTSNIGHDVSYAFQFVN